MRAVTEHFQRPINAIARLELGQVRDAGLATRYHVWLDAQGAASTPLDINGASIPGAMARSPAHHR